MNVFRSLLVLFAAVLSVGLTEVFGAMILSMAPLDLDLTGNLYLSVVIPAVLFTQVLMAFIFWKAFEANPIRNAFIYVIAHAVFQAIELTSFFNPAADVLAYVIIICSSGLLVTTVFNRYFWCAACARVG